MKGKYTKLKSKINKIEKFIQMCNVKTPRKEEKKIEKEERKYERGNQGRKKWKSINECKM